MAERILILGNSAAALAAARAIRARGADDPITMVSTEACAAYSPVLTTYYVRGRVSEADLYICDSGYYRSLGITCRFGVAAIDLDAAAQVVTLADGTALAYDKLLIATGASAKRVRGLDPEVAGDVCYLRTIADARRIRNAAATAGRVVILGAGLVSLQTAVAVSRPGLQVTCIVSSRQILSQNIDAACAEMVRAHIERSGNVRFVFGTGVSQIRRSASGYDLHLDSGEEIGADVIVAGKGVSPNIEFVNREQIGVADGILVDDRMRTNIPNVWAAGDLAQGRNLVTGEVELVANWYDACDQGAVAGANMAGGDVRYAGSVAENITTLFDVPLASIGVSRSRTGDGLREIVHVDERRGIYRKLLLRGDTLVGATLLRDVRDAGVLRGAIVTGKAPWPSAEAAVRGRLKFPALLKMR